MNLSDLLGGSSVELGAIATMPSTTATTITMPNGDVLVSNPTGGTTLVSTSLCATALPAIVNSVNDTVLGGTISKLTSFSYVAQILTNSEGGASTPIRFRPRMFYVGGVYYIFNTYTNATTFGLGYTSSTDNVNWTPAQSIAMLNGVNSTFFIVDITNVAGVWYFLDSAGIIYSTTDVSISANPTINVLPVATYLKFAYINSNWYIVGASRTGSGYIVLKSAALASFTITENTSSVGTAISICQGSGSAGTTEILITLAADNIVKSVDNGATFVLVSAVTAVAGGVIKNCLYSTTTNKYHLAVVGTSDTVVMAVSSGSTLTGATWTMYTCGTGSTNTLFYTVPTIADTGTNVGLLFQNTSGTYNFYYGATYSTVGTAIITANDKNILDNTQADHGISYWVNNKLFVFYGGTIYNGASLFGASGTTISSGITRLLSFPNTNDVWSGVTYLSGSYYSFNTNVGFTTGTANRVVAYLYKFASNFATMSCPVAPVTTSVTGITSAGAKSHGVYDSTGTKINWMACDMISSSTGGNYCFAYDGSAFISTLVTATNPQPITASNTSNTDNTLAYTYTNLSAHKWSSLYSKYIFAMPCVANHATLTTSVVKITSSATIGGAQTDIFSVLQQNAGNRTAIVSCDVLNDGQVIYGYAYTTAGPTYTIVYVIANPTKSTTILSYGNSNATVGMWNFSYGGSNYLLTASASGGGAFLLQIFKLSTTDQSTLIFVDNRAGSPYSNLATAFVTANSASLLGNGMLRRTMLYNGEIYLLDSSTISVNTKGSLKLTPVGSTFAVTSVNLYTTGDGGTTGNANVYSNNNSITTANTTLTPTVVLAAAPTANAYLRIK